MTAKHSATTADIFIGRKNELAQFDQAIRPNKLGAILRGPGTGVRPHVFLPYGIGGMGKTWLARECLKHAQKAGWMTAEIDWDTASTRPTDRLGLMDIVAQTLQEKYGEKLAHEYRKTRGRVKQIQDRVLRYQQEHQEKWQSLVDWVRNATEGVVGLVDDKKGKASGVLVQATGKAVGAGARYLAQAEDAFVNWLVETNKLKPDEALLYREPEQQLAHQLVDVLDRAADSKPLALLFDTCEWLSLSQEEWLRDAMVCPAVKTGKPLVFIVSGRYDQSRERRVGREDGSTRSLKGYGDHLTDPPPVSWNLETFADPEVAEYLQAHELTPTPDLVEFVKRLARGVPFAVQLITQALLKLGIDYVREHFPPSDSNEFSPHEMVTEVTQRFLRYCLEDPVDLERVRGLAVLRQWDDGGLRAIWRLPADALPRPILQELEARYSFVLPGGKLHDIVRDFVRQDLRFSEPETARRLGSAAAGH